jgi:hypothetical protein
MEAVESPSSGYGVLLMQLAQNLAPLANGHQVINGHSSFGNIII